MGVAEGALVAGAMVVAVVVHFGVAGAAGVAAVLVHLLAEKPAKPAPASVSLSIGPASAAVLVTY